MPVIKTAKYGELTAVEVCKELKIQSFKDAKALADAKEIAYKEGFYGGTMIIGDFKGETVQEAKPKVRAQLIERGLAVAYAEPENLVVSRSADECVVALMDQWYLDYGESAWRAQTEKCVVPLDPCVLDALTIRFSSLQTLGEDGHLDGGDP